LGIGHLYEYEAVPGRKSHYLAIIYYVMDYVILNRLRILK
jgi:hypothetical protein